ncbi:hypothetical protein Dimus_024927, partial [Dionaea muscipula]
MDRQEEDQLSSAAIIPLEMIWQLRNSIKHRGQRWSGDELVQRIKNSIQEQQVLGENKQHIKTRNRGRWSWKAPEEDILKINVDAIVTRNGSWIGMVPRNSAGHLIRAAARR